MDQRDRLAAFRERKKRIERAIVLDSSSEEEEEEEEDKQKQEREPERQDRGLSVPTPAAPKANQHIVDDLSSVASSTTSDAGFSLKTKGMPSAAALSTKDMVYVTHQVEGMLSVIRKQSSELEARENQLKAARDRLANEFKLKADHLEASLVSEYNTRVQQLGDAVSSLQSKQNTVGLVSSRILLYRYVSYRAWNSSRTREYRLRQWFLRTRDFVRGLKAYLRTRTS